MKRTFLTKLHINGVYYLIGALLLLVGVPFYQLLLLLPQGYANALAAAGKGAFASYLLWIGNHFAQFLGYRTILIIAFAALVSLPFTLFRIIVAQEILAEDDEENEDGEEEDDEETNEDVVEDQEKEEAESTETTETMVEDGMPAMAWRGKGFAVLAAWSGLSSIVLYVFSTLASTIYLVIVSGTFSAHTIVPAAFPAIFITLSIVTNTLGGGLLALSCLFFGAIIARRGLRLWPGVWVAFGYAALAVAALLSGSAVAVASAPAEGQAALTTPAILLFALWVLWFGIMLVRLKPEV